MKTTAFILLLFVFLHPVHVSLTGIDFNEKDKAFNLFVKVYSDDMQRDMTIEQRTEGDVTVSDQRDFQLWLSKRISLSVNDIPLQIRLINIESDGIEHRFSMKAEYAGDINTVSVSNSINVRLYDDQSNMIMFRCMDVEEGFKLTPEDTVRVFNLK